MYDAQFLSLFPHNYHKNPTNVTRADDDTISRSNVCILSISEYHPDAEHIQDIWIIGLNWLCEWKLNMTH